jgi:hypothetical protein
MPQPLNPTAFKMLISIADSSRLSDNGLSFCEPILRNRQEDILRQTCVGCRPE